MSRLDVFQSVVLDVVERAKACPSQSSTPTHKKLALLMRWTNQRFFQIIQWLQYALLYWVKKRVVIRRASLTVPGKRISLFQDIERSIVLLCCLDISVCCHTLWGHRPYCCTPLQTGSGVIDFRLFTGGNWC